MLDAEEDINAVLRYFSYEHFYVIYCKFWELDADHDFLISKDDMLKYGNHSLTFRILDRIFAQVGGDCCQEQKELLAQRLEPAAKQGRLKLDQLSVGVLRWVGAFSAGRFVVDQAPVWHKAWQAMSGVGRAPVDTVE